MRSEPRTRPSLAFTRAARTPPKLTTRCRTAERAIQAPSARRRAGRYQTHPSARSPRAGGSFAPCGSGRAPPACTRHHELHCPPVARIGKPPDQPGVGELPDDPRDHRGVQPLDLCELARAHPRVRRDRSEHRDLARAETDPRRRCVQPARELADHRPETGDRFRIDEGRRLDALRVLACRHASRSRRLERGGLLPARARPRRACPRPGPKPGVRLRPRPRGVRVRASRVR